LLDSTSSRPKVTGLQLQGRGGQPRPVHARIVVAADGRYSRVARALGLSYAPDRPRRWAVGAYFEDVGGLSTFGEMHVRSGHYLGVAPLPGGVTNACLVSTPHAALRDPSAYLLRALREDDRLGERFAGARLAGPAVSLGPLAVDCGVAGVEGLLLAGDAGGFVDPMTGDGLRFAFRGGEQAAAGALRALERGPASIHDELLLARRREFGRKWAFNRAIRRLVSSPAAIRGATLAASILPGAFELMVRYAGDTRSAEL
jgi:flavin-dependent dehydrogenase